MLSTKRNRKAAKRFFKKALSSNHNQIPRVITVDKDPAYPPAIDELKNDKILPKKVGIRQIKYLNNIIEQDHRSIKRIVNPMLGFQSFRSANKTLKGIEAMNMIKKGQVNNVNYPSLLSDESEEGASCFIPRTTVRKSTSPSPAFHRCHITMRF